MEKIEDILSSVAKFVGPLDSVRIQGAGAEAVLLRCSWFGMAVIVKYRYPKPYRDPSLDRILRKRRTIREAKLLAESKRCGVPVPSLLYVDDDAGILVMDYVEGERLKELVERRGGETAEKFYRIGLYVGRLHECGITHGDLTTSNIIVVESGETFLLDFGLGSFSNELEVQGVDVHLMLRALESTHPILARDFFNKFMEGYEDSRGSGLRRSIELKVREIRLRGRYVRERRGARGTRAARGSTGQPA